MRYVPRAEPDYDKTGIASWYGGRFHGRRTASGHRYDMHAMTAAHKTLPMGTEVKVTNLANQRSAVLLINDRGPFVAGRIIDVSKQAAKKLGFLGAGTAKVRVQAVAGARPVSQTQAAARPSGQTQAGARPVSQTQAAARPSGETQAGARPSGQTEAVARPSDSSNSKYFLPVLARAMEQDARQGEFFWKNPSGGGGSIVALTDPPQAADGPVCRNYRRTAQTGAGQTVYIGRACRAGDGSWRIVREKRK